MVNSKLKHLLLNFQLYVFESLTFSCNVITDKAATTHFPQRETFKLQQIKGLILQ